MNNEEPVKRSLSEVVEALKITESELTFQIKRLLEHVRPRTAAEGKYHEELKAGYQHAAYMVRTLRRYQEGRLKRLDGDYVGSEEGFDSTEAFNDLGVATPYMDDEESPA